MNTYDIIWMLINSAILFLIILAVRWVIKNTKLVIRRKNKEDLVIAGGKVIKDENKTNG